MKRVVLLWLCCLCGSLFAQSVDGGATDMMRVLTDKYQKMSTMQIDYTYKVERDKQTLQSFTGKAYIKGNCYYLTFDNQSFYCDGITMWNYQKETHEVSIFAYDESDDDLLNPARMLKSWGNDYTAKFIREEVQRGIALQIIDLTPKKVSSYYKIRIFVDKVRNEIVRIAIYEKDNTIYGYYFDKFVANRSIPDSYFQFDAKNFPDVEVNDMR